MKLVFVRHGDPDYRNDCLTEKGQREAKLMVSSVAKLNADYYYVSPLGRAQQTAATFFNAQEHPEALKTETCDWLREFTPLIDRPDHKERKSICWDWMPEDWTAYDEFYDFNNWFNNPILEKGGVRSEIEKIYREFEKLLNKHGYFSEGRYFRAEKPNSDTIVIFCHFGITMILLSYLFKISPMVLWHSFISAPTSLTTVITEERRPGKAFFRLTSFSDASHLAEGGEPVSSSGRFCEVYTNADERH